MCSSFGNVVMSKRKGLSLDLLWCDTIVSKDDKHHEIIRSFGLFFKAVLSKDMQSKKSKRQLHYLKSTMYILRMRIIPFCLELKVV